MAAVGQLNGGGGGMVIKGGLSGRTGWNWVGFKETPTQFSLRHHSNSSRVVNFLPPTANRRRPFCPLSLNPDKLLVSSGPSTRTKCSLSSRSDKGLSSDFQQLQSYHDGTEEEHATTFQNSNGSLQ